MKVLTVLGTRPEIIRLSCVIEKLDQLCDHKLVHTGQNFDPKLSDIFFKQLHVRQPDYYLGVTGDTFGQQIGQMLSAVDTVLNQERPDALLILGDTNSGLCTIIAKRKGVSVFHMEAGNRCYDDRVPEEINRRIIDHSSTILMPYTQRSKENLVREGIERERIFVIGNPIYEVLNNFAAQIDASDILIQHGVNQGSYFLVTMHRSENVDDPQRLAGLLDGLSRIADTYQERMLISVHPRTTQKLQTFHLAPNSKLVNLLEPLDFFDFVKLEKNARLVLSDSGTVQEECAIFGVRNITIRDVTERPETIECGSNMLSGAGPEDMLRAANVVLSLSCDWTPPVEYITKNVARTVTKIVLGYTNIRRHYSTLS
jgi:UDP-N-acetylglucosamine 2-epimerase (non-hydrolysing)